MTRRDPPLTKPPLDYVPLEHAIAPPLAHTKTKWDAPSAIKRGLRAAATVAVLPFALVVIGIVLFVLWLDDRPAD